MKMKAPVFVLLMSIVFFSCQTEIKDKKSKVEVEEGAKVVEESTAEQSSTQEIKSEEAKGQGSSNKEEMQTSDFLGFWVGYFRKGLEDDYESTIYVDEGFMWARENKINISIDKITGNEVEGHSVVAGNDRPFSGTMTKQADNSFKFEVREPGDDKYDGTFVFEIKNNKLAGTWNAYKKIEIPKRKYTLEKRTFTYDQNRLLEPTTNYIDWTNSVVKGEEIVEEGFEDEDMGDWIAKEYSTATNLIYKINASNELLAKSLVENLKKGDLTIIRNTIYARHGYSFKNRPLRVFFDAQDWYIPVHSNIKDDFTEIEKENIQLLLRYEKNAKEYYDYFGRG